MTNFQADLTEQLRTLALAIAHHTDLGTDPTTLLGNLQRRSRRQNDALCLADAFLLATGLLAGVETPREDFEELWTRRRLLRTAQEAVAIMNEL